MADYLTGLAINGKNGKPATIATFDHDQSQWIFESIALGTHVVLGYVPQTQTRLGDELKSYHEACRRVLDKRVELLRTERSVLRWKSRHV